MAQTLFTPTLLNSINAKSSVSVSPRGTQFLASSFTRGSFNVLSVKTQRRKAAYSSSIIRCEQSAKGSEQGAAVWLGRFAMIGFATAITVEVSTGKGLLENFGLGTPQPTLALFVSALVVGLTVFFIFQSASRD